MPLAAALRAVASEEVAVHEVREELAAAELPAALYERLGLLQAGSALAVSPADFVECGLVDSLLAGSAWLGPTQQVALDEGAPGTPAEEASPAEEPAEPVERVARLLEQSVAGRSLLVRLEAEDANGLEAWRTQKRPGGRIPEGLEDANAAERAGAARAETGDEVEQQQQVRWPAHMPRGAPPAPLGDVLGALRTGDCFFFSSRGFASRVLRHALSCAWGHLAVVVLLPALPDTPMLLEADPEVMLHVATGGAAGARRWPSAAHSLHLVDARSRLGSWLEQQGNHLVLRPFVGRAQDPDGWCHVASLVATPRWRPTPEDEVASTHLRSLLDTLYGRTLVDLLIGASAINLVSPLHSAEAAALAYAALGATAPEDDPALFTLQAFAERPPVPLGEPVAVVGEL
jgi:hypothetical protein